MENQEIQEYHEFYHKVRRIFGSGSAEDFVNLESEMEQHFVSAHRNDGLDGFMSKLVQDYISMFASQYPERFLDEVRNNNWFTSLYNSQMSVLLVESILNNRQEAEPCFEAVNEICAPNAGTSFIYSSTAYENICNDTLRLAIISENHDFIRKWLSTVNEPMTVLRWDTLSMLIRHERSDVLDALLKKETIDSIQGMFGAWENGGMFKNDAKALAYVEVIYYIASRYLVKSKDDKQTAEMTALIIDRSDLLHNFAILWGEDQREVRVGALLRVISFLKEHNIRLNNFSAFVEYAFFDSSGEYCDFFLENIKSILSDEPYITVDAFLNRSCSDRTAKKFLKKIGMENVLLDITDDASYVITAFDEWNASSIDMKPFMKLPIRVRAAKNISQSKAATALVLSPSFMEFVLDRVEIDAQELNILTERCIEKKAFASLNAINRKIQNKLSQN